jgi:flagellar biosynthesis protein FlhF
MNVRKFLANTAREALKRVRDDLGPDAVILSNRGVDGGVEILALPGDEISTLVSKGQATDDTRRRAVPREPTLDAGPAQRSAQALFAYEAAGGLTDDDAGPEPLKDYDLGDPFGAGTPARAAVPRDEQAPRVARTREWPGRPAQPVDLSLATATASPAPTPQSAPRDGASSETVTALMGEIKAMRSLIEEQLAGFAWGDLARREPARMQVLRDALGAGFSAALVRTLLERMPPGLNAERGLEWVGAALAKNLPVQADETELMEAGGVYALIGPTGVGKTTTTAKLAARYVVRHGADRLALLTTDGYRIGGHEQLRIYGKILGVTVHAVKDQADLRLALAELRNKHLVLIDTVGMGQRDRTVQEQVAMLAGAGKNLRRLLLLNATSHGDTLDEVVRAYQGDGLAGCILTKLDEAVTLGAALDTVIRHRLKTYYLATGQRVPEDLHVANAQYLLQRAMKPTRTTSAFALQDEEMPAVLSAALRSVTGGIDARAYA